MKKRVIAIDGPSGSGKSTVSRILAERLGYLYVNTGDMYRACGVLAKRWGIPFDDEEKLEQFLKGLKFSFYEGKLIVNGEDLSNVIRSEEAGKLASDISKVPIVRKILVEIQRELGKDGVVMEGRDIGTNVFPDTPYKFFLDASPDVRAERRAKELKSMGMDVSIEEIKRKIMERDKQDRERRINPLRPADDAVIIDTSYMTVEEVVERIEAIIHEKDNKS